MKSLLFSLLLFFGSYFQSHAQWKGEHDITIPHADTKAADGEITQIKEAPKFVGRVQGVIGAVYTSNDIHMMPTRNINKISSMTLGVQSNGGLEPIFKGALGGTAYFVDGVRIRSGGIGVAGFSF